MGKRIPPRVSIQGSIITVTDPSKCQTSTRQIKALDVQMLIEAPPLQLNASNDMDSSTTVSRCCKTLHLNANLDRTELLLSVLEKRLTYLEVSILSTSFFVVRVCSNFALLLLLLSIIIPIQFNTITRMQPGGWITHAP